MHRRVRPLSPGLVLLSLAALGAWTGAAAGTDTAPPDPCAGIDPAAVPDIVYTRGFAPDQGVYAARADGSARVRVTPPAQLAFSPTLAPEGCRVAFVAHDDDQAGEDDIHVGSIDGSTDVRITRTPDWEYNPSWSPTGDLIAFTTDRGGLQVVRPDGGGRRRVTPPKLSADSPSWSPDGTRIVFSGLPYAEVRPGGRIRWDLYVVGVDGRNPQRLTRTGDALEAEPAWSPDGSLIVYYDLGDEPARAPAIYVVPSDGSGAPVRVAAGDVSYPSWTPDGRVLFLRRTGFTQGNSGTPISSISTIAADGSDERVLIPGEPAFDPEWRRGAVATPSPAPPGPPAEISPGIGAGACATRPFLVTVRGGGIAGTTFSVDGRPLRTVSAANTARLALDPASVSIGLHQVTALVSYADPSLPPETLSFVFGRCGAEIPARARFGRCASVRVASAGPGDVVVQVRSGPRRVRVFGGPLYTFTGPGTRVVCLKIPPSARGPGRPGARILTVAITVAGERSVRTMRVS